MNRISFLNRGYAFKGLLAVLFDVFVDPFLNKCFDRIYCSCTSPCQLHFYCLTPGNPLGSKYSNV